MDIYPQNLGERNHIEIVRRRAAAGVTDPNVMVNQPLTPKLGWLGKYWARGTKMNDEQAAVANPAASSQTQTAGWLMWFLGSIFAGLGAALIGKATHNPALGWTIFTTGTAGLTVLGFGPMAQYAFRQSHRALMQSEVEEMITRYQDDLLRKAYLQLVRDAVLVPIPDPPAENVRLAIEALGEAIEGLPPVIYTPVDISLLHEQAAQLRQKAATESDFITADSFTRQADSLEQRIETAEHSALVAKRSTALREEIIGKIAALREAIAAQQTGIMDITAIAELSESARHVAREAQNTASAKDELARYLTPQNEAEANIQKLGR
jgi:hypothetical protein